MIWECKVMNSEITKSNGKLDANKLFNKVQSLNSQLGELQKKAEDANIMPTKNVSGSWIFKTEHINSDKIELLGKNAYAQALVLSELYEIQMQAMQLSVGSFDALKTVNKELTKAMKIGFSESGAQNQQLFSKTQEQIKRIAVFAKNYADNLDKLKSELSKDFKNDLSKYVEADDVEKQIKKAIKNYVKKEEIENLLEQNIQGKIGKSESRTEEYIDNQISDLKEKLKDYSKITQVEENINHIEELVKKLEERIKVLEGNTNPKQKINGQTIGGLVLGLIGTILALLSIFVL